MDRASADVLAMAAGAVLTRISPVIHGTTHIPLDKDERDQLGAALVLVFEKRLQTLLVLGDDLVALGAVTTLILMKREALASLEEEERAKAKKNGDGAEEGKAP